MEAHILWDGQYNISSALKSLLLPQINYIKLIILLCRLYIILCEGLKNEMYQTWHGIDYINISSILLFFCLIVCFAHFVYFF